MESQVEESVIQKRPFLTDGRRMVLSEISRDAAQVFFASLVVGFLLLDQDVGLMTRGLILSLGCWILSMGIVKT